MLKRYIIIKLVLDFRLFKSYTFNSIFIIFLFFYVFTYLVNISSKGLNCFQSFSPCKITNNDIGKNAKYRKSSSFLHGIFSLLSNGQFQISNMASNLIRTDQIQLLFTTEKRRVRIRIT